SDRVTLDRIVMDPSRPGVVRARVTVILPAAADLERAAEALTPRDTAETDEPGPDEPAAAEPAPDPDAGEGREARIAPALSTLEIEGLHRLDVRLVAEGTVRTLPVRPRRPWNTAAGSAFRPGADADFTLSRLYSVGGLYRDTNRDLVPDELAGYVALAGTEAPAAVADFATRLGLETAGLRLPMTYVAGQRDDLEADGFPILVGTRHYQTRRLREAGKLHGGDPAPGEGFVELVDGAFGARNAMVVGGADEAGLGAALDWLAGRAPYLWTHGKGEYALSDVETAARRFFQAREAPGQLALGLAKLGTWMDRMLEADESPARVEVELAAQEAPAGLDRLATDIVRERFPEADIAVSTFPTGFGVGDTIFTAAWDLPWEVDDARRILDEDVYPRVRPGLPTRVEVRVSEPPEVRERLADEVRAALAARGVTDPEVHVLSAYKQGYSWIEDVILPELKTLPVAAVDITYHTLEESDEVRWQSVAADTRWLQEIYPIDAILARELAIPDTAVAFHTSRALHPIYTFVARDSAGAEVLRETFDPRYVIRPFFDLFPEYERVRVTTGWITATSGADTLTDRRVVTDPERFWDRLQTETFADIVDYVMDTQDGRPSPSNAPYFDEFTVRLRLSEPNHRIGVDEEVISSLEALHEDIYFETLTLFGLIGARYQTSLPYFGRVLPYIDPTGAGEPGRADISFTGKERGAAELRVRTFATPDDPAPTTREYGLGALPTETPKLTGVTVAAGDEGLRRLLFRVTAADSADRFDELKERSSEAGIDRQFLSVELLDGMLDALRRLHGAGLVRDALSWDRVDEVAIDFRVEDDSAFHRRSVLPRSAGPASATRPRLAASGWRDSGEPMVQWDTPIPPVESDSVLARLGTFPGVDVYWIAESFLGQNVFAADFLPPHEAAYVSQAKLNALKPTLFLSGRQHANEVSSTSHILRLGELLVADSTYRSMLRRVNVVLHPITNPDGARLAVEMQETNPDFMLHAGYLGALGVDATSGEGDDDPVYPESQARRRIRETWLPDIYINMHGYPSHEWVQYFAGYSAWVRGRQGGQRSWWTPRGWFIPGLGWADDDDNPDYRTAQFAILDSVASAMTASPGNDVSRRLYARYRKYGEQDQDDFTEYFHNGILVNLRLRGSESIGQGAYSQRITYFSTTTEAPDETARGDWLHTVATMGLTHSTALLRYLATGEFRVEREAEAYEGVVTRKIFRVKPVMPGGGDESDDSDDPAEPGESGRREDRSR
ncbi:MAG TPA: M14 family zinc carboxypeptidase, partial [Longimicrobiales bacterium]